MKYEFNSHPVNESTEIIKRDYIKLLQHIILQNCGTSEVINDMFYRGQKSFGINVPIQLLSDNELCSAITNIGRKTFEYKKVFHPYRFVYRCFCLPKQDYKFLLIAESFYIVGLIKGCLKNDELKRYCDLLIIESKDEAQIITFLEAIILNNNFLKAVFMDNKEPDSLINECRNKPLRSSMEYIHKNTNWNKDYYSLPRYSVAVCGTMSSGKSTFVNALLGYDYIPSSNQACTAKITSISDNDYLRRIIGCSISETNEVDYNSCLDRKKLEEWNENERINRIVLEGELEEVRSKSGVLVIHDTPGTNFSQKEAHSQYTVEFLKNNKLNLIIYLINAEHSATTDNTILLKNILEICKVHQETKILFFVNKLDSFDIEGQDDIKECLEGVKKELSEIGFKSPLVLPIIANGARLFKMVLKGATLTKREIMSFEECFEFCMNKTGSYFDATKPEYTGLTFTDSNKIIYGDITVGGKIYRKEDLQEALKRSGITMVTQILDNQINGGR